MKEIILVEGSENLFIQVDSVNEGEVISEKHSSGKALAKVRNAVREVGGIIADSVKVLQEVDVKPDELELNVGVNFTLEGSAYIVSSGVDASLVIKAKWKK